MSNAVRFTLIGVAITAAIFGLVIWNQWHAHMELQGSIMKVRTQKTSDADTIVVVDARIVNPSEYAFIVKDIIPTVTTKTGEKIDGEMVAGVDADRVFAAYPDLGQKFNPAVKFKDRLAPGQTADRTILVTFKAPVALIESRKNLLIHFDELNNASAEIVEHVK